MTTGYIGNCAVMAMLEMIQFYQHCMEICLDTPGCRGKLFNNFIFSFDLRVVYLIFFLRFFFYFCTVAVFVSDGTRVILFIYNAHCLYPLSLNRANMYQGIVEYVMWTFILLHSW